METNQTTTKFSFSNLCKLHFRSQYISTPPRFTRKDPRQPLLKSTADQDFQIILKIWRTILRFMDTNETSENSKSRQKKKVFSPPVMPRLRQELSNKIITSSHGPAEMTVVGGREGGGGGGVNPSSPVGRSASVKMKEKLRSIKMSRSNDKDLQQIIPVDETLFNGFDQMQYVIGVGLLKPRIRDEVYCMILRQLTNNNLKTGKIRLWSLLHLMVGVYPPSQEIIPYVTKFVEDGKTTYSTSMMKLLTRVLQKGCRFQPPSQVEYTAVLNNEPLDIPVTLMDGSSYSIDWDSCTTAAEVIAGVAEEIELEEKFGFSLFMAMDNKISSLGNAGDQVFDSISHCEQLHRNQSDVSYRVEDAPWRLFIRKEMFSPWDEITGNPVSTNLIYAQIARGIMLGEYVCDRDGELAAVAARQYYIEFECDISEDNLYSVLPSYIPADKLTGEDSVRVWCRQVARFLKRMITVYSITEENKRTINDVKEELVTWAKRKWPNSFSRYFDVIRLEGPRLGNSDSMTLGINSTGIVLMDEKGEVGMEMSFPQISSVMGDSYDPGLKLIIGSIIIFVFADGTLMKFNSSDADDIYQLITSNISGLLVRSTWAVAKQEFQETPEDASEDYVKCIEGDLIRLEKPARDETMTSDVCKCENMATEEKGIILTNLLHIIPCLEEPKEDILRLFRSPNYHMKRSAKKREENLVTSVDVHISRHDDGEERRSLNITTSENAEADVLFFSSDKNNDGGGDFSQGRRTNIDGGEIDDLEDYESDSSSIGFDQEFFTSLSLLPPTNKPEENTTQTSTYV